MGRNVYSIANAYIPNMECMYVPTACITDENCFLSLSCNVIIEWHLAMHSEMRSHYANVYHR